MDRIFLARATRRGPSSESAEDQSDAWTTDDRMKKTERNEANVFFSV